LNEPENAARGAASFERGEGQGVSIPEAKKFPNELSNFIPDAKWMRI
jgi:hypothetical protein